MTNNDSFSILIVEDHYAVSRGLKTILSECFPMVVCYDANVTPAWVSSADYVYGIVASETVPSSASFIVEDSTVQFHFEVEFHRFHKHSGQAIVQVNKASVCISCCHY